MKPPASCIILKALWICFYKLTASLFEGDSDHSFSSFTGNQLVNALTFYFREYTVDFPVADNSANIYF